MRPRLRGRIGTYSQFWPAYLYSHRNRYNRILHHCAGLFAVTVCAAAVHVADVRVLVAVPLAWVIAWIGHVVFEKNIPPTLRGYPLWSLYSDFKMTFFWLFGRLKKEYDKFDIIPYPP